MSTPERSPTASPAGSPKTPGSPRTPGSPGVPGSPGSPVQIATPTSATAAGTPTQVSSGSPLRESPPSPPPLECPDCEPIDTDLNATPGLNKSQAGRPDPANTEFVYYSATLREIAPQLTSDVDRQAVIPWLRKLFRPEYHTSRFRTKRNKFLLYLCLTLMNDEVHGMFKKIPPKGALPDFESIPNIVHEEIPPAEWELDTMWLDVMQGVPRKCEKMKCSIHLNNPALCGSDKAQADLLDDEFAYMLYLARPFAILLPRPDDRTKVASWFQTLCTIQPSSCSTMKHIRNDYLTALLGYLHELRLAGPFSQLPDWDPLPSLEEAVRIASGKLPLDPCRNDADEFFASQPMPDEGAFCYLAVTGELLDSALQELEE